jgi:hypothetical protein
MIGMMLVGFSIVYTGIAYLFGSYPGVPTFLFLIVIAVGIAISIAGALLAKHYL